MTNTIDTPEWLKSNPFRFAVQGDDFRKAFDVARLAGEYAYITLCVDGSTLHIHTEGVGVSCSSRCPIHMKSDQPDLQFAVSMVRAPVEELARAPFERMECKVEVTKHEKAAQPSQDTTWTFEFGATHTMQPAVLIPMPAPLPSGDAARPIAARPLAQALRLLRPFTDPESKKNQFMAAFIGEGSGHARVSHVGRRIIDPEMNSPPCYVGSRQIADAVHVMSRFVGTVNCSADEEHVLLQDATTTCRLRKGTASAEVPTFNPSDWDWSVKLVSSELNQAIQTICAQAKDNAARIRVEAAPDKDSSMWFTTTVTGGTARLRLALPEPPQHAVDLAFSAGALKKLIVPSGGAGVELFVKPYGVAARQVDGDVSIDTIASALASTR